MNLEPFFKSKKIAIIGASRTPGKIGNTILKQLMGRNFELYPVNPNAEDILGYKTYESVLQIPAKPELAVIATPAETIPAILDQCGKKGIRHVIIISAGFKEIGNANLEKELQDKLKGNKITCIGPNCLGVFDAHTKLDTLFLPKERLKRPKPGELSFITQSGATGSAVLDLAAHENYGFAKFISYGNAANVDESDLIEYLARDPDTKIICMYTEQVQNGKKFLETTKKCKKPILVIKGGVTEAGAKAAKSHTGALAGSAEVYYGAFKQSKLVISETLQELFKNMKIFEKTKVQATGNKVQIITNGGGYGILTADAVIKNGLKLARPGKPIKELRKKFPPTVVIGNPTDLLGDATTERYKLAIEAAIKDTNNDSIILITLTQTPLLDESIVETIKEAYKKSQKPIVLVSTGSEHANKIKTQFETAGIPCFTFPENAANALAAYTRYCIE
ncbi:CoA-binding protein [Candidatus Woesearchaeota archaeon]|nr:CoA-binding protein [Candidatus Woesearchaeota archaeon]MBW3016255.1 CoA-binding protein [Candidatus Woesearchaeota archaeon]